MKSKAYPVAASCWAGVFLSLFPFLGGCADSPPWGAWSRSPSPEEVAAVMGRPLETYIFFSQYDVYQNEQTKEYVYRGTEGWIRSPFPPAGLLESKLRESPSEVRMLRGGPDRSEESYASERPKPSSVVAATR
jgi:hypothetical protein